MRKRGAKQGGKPGVDKSKVDEFRRTVYHAVPQKFIREMSGRQTKQLHEQAERYGLPFGGATVDLYVFFPALFDFLAANALKLKGPEPGADGVPADAGDRKKLADALRSEHKLRVETGQVISKTASERQVMEVIAHYEKLQGSMPGQLAAKLANRPLAECKRRLRAFAAEATRRVFGETKG